MTGKKKIEPQPGDIWVDCKMGTLSLVQKVSDTVVYFYRPTSDTIMASPMFRDTHRPIRPRDANDAKLLLKYSDFLDPRVNETTRILLHPIKAIAYAESLNLFS